MSRSKKFDDDNDDIALIWDDELDVGRFLDSMAEPTVVRRRKRHKFRTMQRLYDLEEERWLRRQLDDWETDRLQ